jgi:hypothetical protein
MATNTPKSFRPSLRTTLRRSLGLPVYRFVLGLRSDSTLSPFQKFVRDGYHRRLENDLQLTSNSVVFDFGGYVGDLSWRLHKLFQPRLRIFEPVPQFVEILRQRFEGLSNVTLYPFAIGGIDRRETFAIGAAETGAFAQAQESIESEAIYFTPFYLPKSAFRGKMIRTSPTQIPILKTADLIGLISKKSKNISKFKINLETKIFYLRLQLTSYTIAI